MSAKPVGLAGLNLNAQIDHIRMSVYYNVPLPVTLIYFNSELTDNIAKLTWKMDYYDEKKFSIQRSTDALLWTNIKTYEIEGNGVNSVFYYNDELLNPGKYYYRLMFTSVTGMHEYSVVKTVNFEFSNSLKVFPVPASSVVFLNGIKGTGKIILTDLNGRIIKIPVEGIGNNIFRINISTLFKGIYLLQADNRAGRIIKE